MGAKKGTNILKDSQFDGWKFCPRHNTYYKSVDGANGEAYLLSLVYGRDILNHHIGPWEDSWEIIVWCDPNKKSKNADKINCFKDGYYFITSISPFPTDKSLKSTVKLADEKIIPFIEKEKSWNYNDINITQCPKYCYQIPAATPNAIVPMEKEYAAMVLTAIKGIKGENWSENAALKNVKKQMKAVVAGKQNYFSYNWQEWRLWEYELSNVNFSQYWDFYTRFIALVWECPYFRNSNEVKKFATKSYFKKFIESREDGIEKFVKNLQTKYEWSLYVLPSENFMKDLLKNFDINEVEKLI